MTTSEAHDLGSSARQLRAKTLGPNAAVRASLAARVDPAIERLRVVADEDDDVDTTTLEREFPTVAIVRARRHEPGDLVIDDFAWRGAFDVGRFDEAMIATPLPQLAVRGVDAPGVAVEVLSRYQRLVLRRNEASATAVFDAVLDGHARLFHAVPFDHEHAVDTWQWVLRLDASAGLVVQLAALFHDVERIHAEEHERLEHRARRLLDGAVAADRSAGVERARTTLRGAGVEGAVVERVCDLVRGTSFEDAEAAVLDDADCLSFLSLMSPAYADYFGLAQTRRKVTFTLNRLGAAARSKVALVRLRPDVHRLLQPG